MKNVDNKEDYQKIRERIHCLPITAWLKIDQDRDLLDLNARRPDFGLYYHNQYVGIEVTEVRPHKYNNEKKIDLIAINKTLEQLIRIRLNENRISAFRIDVVPNESIYLRKLCTRDTTLLAEIDQHLQGNPKSYDFIESITAEPFVVEGIEYTIPNDKIDIHIEWGGRFAETIPIEPVIEAIKDKERKVDSYLEENDFKFDKLWLFITMPNEEHMFSFKGFQLPEGFESIYDQIYIGQLFPPFANCIYTKSDNPKC